MTESRVAEGRRLSVFFTAEAAFQSQKKVIVLKQDSQACHTGSKEKIHNKKNGLHTAHGDGNQQVRESGCD